MGSSSLTHTDCVATAAENCFQQLCGLDLQSDGSKPPACEEGTILAVISVGCSAFDWSIILGLPASTATAVAKRFSGFEIPFESDDMGDAMGELANIFAGLTQQELAKRGVNTDISLPSIMRGQQLSVLAASADTTSISFQSELGSLYVAVMGQQQEVSDGASTAEQGSGSAQQLVDLQEEVVRLRAENKALRRQLDKLTQGVG